MCEAVEAVRTLEPSIKQDTGRQLNIRVNVICLIMMSDIWQGY